MATREQRKRVRAAFDGVLKTYFSQWDAGSSWAIRIETQSRYTDERGRCIPDRRVITVNPGVLARPSDELEELLVHECCHAVTTPVHDAKWFAQMRSAADRANRVGRSNVAVLIARDIDHCRALPGGEQRDIATVRETIKSILLKAPEANIKQLIRALCREECLPRKVLLGRYPTIQSECRKAKADSDALIAAERAWREDPGRLPGA